LICHSEVAPRGKTFSGRLADVCFTPMGIVTTGHLVLTRSGQVNLSCHVHPRVPASMTSPSSTPVRGQGVDHRWQHGAVAGIGPQAVGRKLGHLR
jgi:hypothetical protein